LVRQCPSLVPEACVPFTMPLLYGRSCSCWWRPISSRIHNLPGLFLQLTAGLFS
jgi:hypothetical protein